MKSARISHLNMASSRMGQAKTSTQRSIATNRKARHDYTLETPIEAGLVLEGWEVKAIRAHRVQLKDSYCLVKRGEIWLINAHISPLDTTAAYTLPNPTRSRKCLLHKKQVEKLIGAIQRKGYSLIPMELYWVGPHVKLKIALAKGKKKYDKRQSEKEKDWQRDQAKLQKQMKTLR